MVSSRSRRFLGVVVVGGALVAAAAAYSLFNGAREALPSPDAPAYAGIVRAFYHGIAALESGLVDDAKARFTEATGIVPAEAAAWANLGIAHLRVAEFDAAAAAVTEAARLAPDNGNVAMLQGALEGARGQLDPALAHLRRAVSLAPQDPRVRFALSDMIQRAGGPDADAESALLIDQILEVQPGNVALLAERLRLAVRRADTAALQDTLTRLSTAGGAWPPAAVEQLNAVRQAAAAGDVPAAARAAAFLRNVLARVPAFRDGLAAVSVPAELIADPFERFLVLPVPEPTASPRDTTLAYARDALDGAPPAAAVAAVFQGDADGTAVLVAVSSQALTRLDRPSPGVRFPGGFAGAAPTASGVLPLDWNHDFRTDLALAGAGGVRLLIQAQDGTFADNTAAAARTGGGADIASAGAWAADVEMDGDLDIVLGAASGDPPVLRNTGDGAWQVIRPFAGVPGARGFAWGDLDGDGDPDAAFLDGLGALHVFANQQAGQFERRPGPVAPIPFLSLTMGDTNADGALELVTLDRMGGLARASLLGDAWRFERIAEWPERPVSAAPGSHRLLLADLDNNGAVDLLASGGGATQLWLADERLQLEPLSGWNDVAVSGVMDLTADGRLDLVGVSSGQPVRLTARGERPYHWQVIRPQAQTAAGDQRINAFGVGGEIEIRAGLLVQKQVLTGGPVHFGLGVRTGIDVARIVWPNGVMQAEFDVMGDRAVTASQRLKGSCPWLFAWNGDAMEFVTDVLWRSPLGLRVNAQDTAGVVQTEDWVKIRADQLLPRDGAYDVRITAELWETHFFDHVSLLLVDRPDDVDMFVDERFARVPPVPAVHAVTGLTPVAQAWDDGGRDVTALVRARDGQYLSGFERGAYQGVTRDHYVELAIASPTARGGPRWLVAHGWVYPTDSSINVAIGQGSRTPPYGLSLEAQGPDGTWRVVHPDVGFPAGKTKTILVDLDGVPSDATRLRLRTNMEIYWDSLATATAAPATPLRTARLAATKADLRYRGFSRTDTDTAAHAPELPRYGAIANTTPRWRDLVGYHTRFGDVSELLSGVDDRYVIMNAGDELRLAFAEQPPPPAGWTREYVLISDGWEKDGDFNTGFSKTVQPLPSHDRPDYGASSSSLGLEDDPVYRRHPEDWQRFHTRFVSPDRYVRGLRTR